jgi:cell division transport system ATP-binding protein
MSELVVQLKNTSIYQGGNLVLGDVNFEMKKGDFVYLIGKTGTGKSSFLKTLYGDLDLTEGEGFIVGFDLRKLKEKDIPFLRRKLGVVFQDFKLLNDRTVDGNLEFVLRATGWKNKEEIATQIEEVLEKVDMKQRGYKYPYELLCG